ncbi:MAG: GNAT family N-acetyltransferase [Polyangiaceae bacterium]|nr:GNAT family N-acetyltransferase [Myxococcales bacterium]MCB9585285.1 GNAT family N-acetyltransferase [Polyangiaceae bacterium]MCB9606698.1 GNAT family N-acetyltransferase [Polyangiaceae bacterium]
MNQVVETSDRAAIERFLRRDPFLHLYELGDLDPFFWPHTRWFGWMDEANELQALALLYTGTDLPVLLGLGRDDEGMLGDLIEAATSHLPAEFYAHLSPGLAQRLAHRFTATGHGLHLKMALQRKELLSDIDMHGVTRLTPSELCEILALYEHSYPNNWFDPRMLETGEYFGLKHHNELVCVAGVHVYSRAFRVAALGNVATHPAHRGQGLARRAVAALCASLLEHVDFVGLNVHADNRAAIACYERLGFVEVAQYEEFMLRER